MIEYPKSSDTPVSHLPFSPATRVGELIFVSGQASVDTTGRIISDTFEGEMRRSIENLARVLRDAGSDLAHVVQTRNYVRDADDLPAFNLIYRVFPRSLSGADDDHELPLRRPALRNRMRGGCQRGGPLRSAGFRRLETRHDGMFPWRRL
jgi:2-iminobutanoate/2-iminopropanoate deaminase